MLDLLIIGGSAVPIYFAQSVISKSRILDFVIIAEGNEQNRDGNQNYHE